MLTGVLCLFLAVVCAVEAQHDTRYRRATGSSSSSSYSSSGSGSGSGGNVRNVGASGGGGFQYPTNEPYPYYPFHNPMFGGGGYPMFDFNAIFQQYLASLAAAHAYAAQNPQYAPFPGPDSNAIVPDAYGGGGSGYGNAGNPVFASASASLGPEGGYGQGQVAPGGPDGLGLRIAQDFAPPSGGGSFGTFSSSSSGSSDVNGKRTSFKTATFGTNDNGKISFKTVSE